MMMKFTIAIPFILSFPWILTQCDKVHPEDPIDAPDRIFLSALIEDMTGIEKLINLKTLLCHENAITSSDVSNNSDLDSLNCSENQLSSLDVSKNTALTWLNCGRIASLQVGLLNTLLNENLHLIEQVKRVLESLALPQFVLHIKSSI